MGKIYQDVDQKEDNSTQDMVDRILEVGLLVEGRGDVKFRENEINRIYNIMDKADMRTVMLVGDHGSGKKTIVEGYVNKLDKNVRNDKVVEIDFNEVIKQSRNSDFTQVVNDILYVVGHNESFEITLVLNNIGHLLNLNCYGNAGFAFVNSLVSSIVDDNIKVIVTATNDEYKVIEDMFKMVLDYFTVIKINELTKEQSADIVEYDRDFFEGVYDMKLPADMKNIICDNADKYIKGRSFPGKAEQLLDEVCASISNKYRPADPRLIEYVHSMEALQNELKEAVDDNDFQRCDTINARITETSRNISNLGKEAFPTIDVTEEDMFEAIGEIVNVKMSRLTKDQTAFLREMPNEIKKYVIGQDDAVDVIVKNIRRNQLGLRKTGHSAGNFMFIGSTGVGKTYLAKQLAKYLYGSEENLLRLDMSEFQAEIDVSKLLGSAPGYVGYKESGLLVKGLAKKPETVVLFDEIEKAHPKIYDVLLQLLDEGFVTGSDGKKVDATKALIIFTSNIGVKQAQEMSSPLGFTNNVDEKKNERKESIIRKALKNRFSPEFLNRLDNICYFKSLNEDTLKSILYKELDETNEKIKVITGKTVVLSVDAEKWILDKVNAEDNGARPIIRTIQQYIEEPLADMVINDDSTINSEGDTLTAYLENDNIIIR